MDQVRTHFREHGTIHLIWLIVTLTLCCIALIVYQPDADKVNSFLSFAATITSLFLAVIAIFYSIVANSDLAASLAKSSEGAANIGKLVDRVDVVSNRLEQHSNQLDEALDRVPVALDELRSDIRDKLDAFTQPETIKKDADGKQKVSGPIAIVVCLYAICKAFQENKEITPKNLPKDGRFLRGILLGFLSCMKAFKPMDVEMEYASGTFRVLSAGGLDVEKWANFDFSEEVPTIQKGKKQIDIMLGICPNDEDEETDQTEIVAGTATSPENEESSDRESDEE